MPAATIPALELYRQSTQHIGGQRTVLAGLADLIWRTEADELMITTQTHDPADRLHSFELIAAGARGSAPS